MVSLDRELAGFIAAVRWSTGKRRHATANAENPPLTNGFPGGGVFSAKREYLTVSRMEHTFDICAAPFGNGFFVSWRLSEVTTVGTLMLLKIPVLGPALLRVFRPVTYYRWDTALMFQSAVHAAVLEVLDQRTSAQGLRSLSEIERKPILRDLFK